MTSPGRAHLAAALADHRAAHEAYVRRAGRIPSDQWRRPATPGKWSPSEITEHLRLALETLRRELEGQPAMRVILTPWKRFTLRWTILPSILRTGRFPRGVRAPREIRPADPPEERDEALRRLDEAHARFASACGEPSAAGRRLTHPYFGPLPLTRFHRLLARHADHHARQLPPDSER
jgi:hypothetical protein